jgi:cytidylate kinase
MRPSSKSIGAGSRKLHHNLYNRHSRKEERTLRNVTRSPSLTTSTPLLVAIDGPAGAGKSTVAARLATRLGIPYLDTGAMYRAVALLALRRGIELPLDESAAKTVCETLDQHRIDVVADSKGTRILVDDEDVSSEIRTPNCSLMASAVSALAEVREALVPMQRRLGLVRGGVMEGRDIGTVVFPDAQVKIFLTASAEERALRRHRDLSERDVETSIEEVRVQQHQRDHQDTSRVKSPLQVARGSVVVDTTGLTLDDVVERLLEEVASKNPGVA